MGINTIWDVAEWDIEPPHRWISWMIPERPVDLENEKIQFMNFLSMIALMARESKDSIGWGITDLYKVVDGYKVFSAIPNVINNPTIWKSL